MSLKIQTLSTFHNKLLNRHELTLQVSHPAASFKKADLRSALSKQYRSSFMVIQNSKTMFGTNVTRTKVRVYEDREQFVKIEDWYVLFGCGEEKKTKDGRRVRKDKRKRRVEAWGSVRRQDKKSERKQK